jgi:hypothetical protein
MLNPIQVPRKFIRRPAAASGAEASASVGTAKATSSTPEVPSAAGSTPPSLAPAQAQANYFNLHVEGVGYLNRVRVIKPKNGQEFIACTISAMRGSADDVGYTKFDCRVSGAQAQKVVRMLEDDVAAERRVIVGFRLADIYPEIFTFEKGENKGLPGVAIKGRLLRVKFAKVNGVSVDLPESSAPATGTEGEAADDSVPF